MLIYVKIEDGEHSEKTDALLLFITDDGKIVREKNDSFGYYERVGEIDFNAQNDLNNEYGDAPYGVFDCYGVFAGYMKWREKMEFKD